MQHAIVWLIDRPIQFIRLRRGMKSSLKLRRTLRGLITRAARGRGEDTGIAFCHDRTDERRGVISFAGFCLRRGLFSIVFSTGGWKSARRNPALKIKSGPVALGPVLGHDIPAVLMIVLLAYVHITASALPESVDPIVDRR